MNRRFNVKFKSDDGEVQVMWCDSVEMKLWLCHQQAALGWEADPDDYYQAMRAIMHERAPA